MTWKISEWHGTLVLVSVTRVLDWSRPLLSTPTKWERKERGECGRWMGSPSERAAFWPPPGAWAAADPLSVCLPGACRTGSFGKRRNKVSRGRCSHPLILQQPVHPAGTFSRPLGWDACLMHAWGMYESSVAAAHAHADAIAHAPVRRRTRHAVGAVRRAFTSRRACAPPAGTPLPRRGRTSGLRRRSAAGPLALGACATWAPCPGASRTASGRAARLRRWRPPPPPKRSLRN